MKIFIVTAGTYSDYHICGVCSTRERADRNATLFDGGVEEYEVDSFLDEHPGVPFEVRMYDNGDYATTFRLTPNCLTPGIDWRLETSVHHADRFIFRVWADDERHAIKIANERRAMLLASGNIIKNTWHKYPK